MTQIPTDSVTPPEPTEEHDHDPLVILGLSAVALAAALSSAQALYGVALTAGWSKTMAPLFPVTIDATALVATRIWLAASTPTAQARRFARTVAIGAVLVSLLGNGVYHLAQARVIHPGVAVVIAAGAVPPLALAVVCHLAVLRSAAPAPVVETATETAPVSGPASEPEPVVPATVPDMTTDTNPAPKPPARRADTAAKVARLRQRHPDMTSTAMAVKLGVSDRTVRRHLAALAAA